MRSSQVELKSFKFIRLHLVRAGFAITLLVFSLIAFAAESVLMMKDDIRVLSERLLSRKAQRLATEDQDYLELVRMEMSFVNQMRRIYTLAKRIAKVVLPPVLAQRD